MSNTTVELTIDEGIAWMTMVNPPKKNALSASMMSEMSQHLERVASDVSVTVVVLTGTQGTFCSGLDLGSIRDAEPGSNLPNMAQDLEAQLRACPHPTVALVEGFAVGAGCQLASACDFRLMVEGARFGLPPAKVGLVYPPQSLHRMRELVGDTQTRRLIFTADMVDAAEATRLGWAFPSATRGDAVDQITAWSQVMGSRSALTIRATKELLNDPANAAERFAYWDEHSDVSGEQAAGVRAFAERHEPQFPSRTPRSAG